MLSLIVIDGTDNVNYFIYKFNISKKNQKRILFLDKFNSQKITKKTFSKENLNKIFYFYGRETLIDVVYFRIFKSSKVDGKLLKIIEDLKNKEVPIMPINASTLMNKYSIQEGKEIGTKLKAIEEVWVNNNFKISDNEIQKIVSN